MIKAVFFDIDGTLVSFSQKFLSDRLLADLAALRETNPDAAAWIVIPDTVLV